MQNVSLGRLKILMAKYIKATSKHMKDVHVKEICFDCGWNYNKTIFSFDDKEFRVDEILNMSSIMSTATDALKETTCNGLIYPKDNSVRVRLFGKPTKQFNTLVRLIYKYSGVMIEWGDIKMEAFDSNPLNTTYLCYNENACKEAIDFIRSNRTSKDKLTAELNSRIIDGVIHDYLSLTITNPSGVIKANKEIW